MNNFIVLNLSDLHIDAGKELFQREIIGEFIRDFQKYIQEEDHLEWMPDYIVISGDVINKGDTNNYPLADELLRKISQDLGIDCSCIIMTPGNHDKENSSICSKADYKTAKENFNLFCKINQKLSSPKDQGILDSFLKIHEKGFGEFNHFHEKIAFDTMDGKSYQYRTYPLFECSKIKYVSGIKIFPENQVCFLTLNTEWLYANNDIIDQIPKKDVEFKTGRNIVGYLYHQLMKHCPDYTIITLMHRNPYDISWDEVNNTDSMTKHALAYIEHCSDIIISGHDHSVKTGIPDLIKNQVQHFRLGSPSLIPGSEGANFPYSISVLKIDNIAEKIELLRGTYETPSIEVGEAHWSFKELAHHFPLRNKYDKKRWNTIHKNTEKKQSVACIKVKNFSDEEIKQKIYQYFFYNETMQLSTKPVIHILNINTIDIEHNNYDSINELLKEENSLTHLILYFKNYHDKDILFNTIQEEYRKFTDKFRIPILLGKLVTNLIAVEIPLKCSKKQTEYFSI